MTKISDLLNSGSTLPYDQPEIEAVMKKLLYEQGITDVLYEGSNISQLTSVISYVIGSLNVNTAINLQETILPLATKRMNVLFGARQQGYEPHALKSYKYKIQLKPEYDDTKVVADANGLLVVDRLNQEKRDIPLVKNTKFFSGGNTYYYLGPTIEQFFQVSNFQITNGYAEADPIEIIVTEGDLIQYDGLDADPTLSFIVKDYPDIDGVQKPEQEFLIPFHNIEDDGIQVFVKSPDYTQINNGITPYKTIEKFKSANFLIDESFTQEKDKFIRMENIILQYPVIFFEYSGMGEAVNTGDEIYINVLLSKGEDGAAGESFIVENSTASQLFRALPAYETVQRGRSEESSDEIKENASAFHNTANRAVTQLDYLAICKRHAIVNDAYAWGGEEELDLTIAPPTPPELPQSKIGHVWTSTVPDYINDFIYTKKVISVDTSAYALQGSDTVANILLKAVVVDDLWVATSEGFDSQGGTVNIDDGLVGVGTDWIVMGPVYDKYENYENFIDSTIQTADEDHNWYLTQGEIYGVHTQPVSPTDYDGLLDYLDFYKIITMEVHHRHPLYIDFEYLCDVVKYDLTKSKQEINYKVFEGIREYFADQLEAYDTEYLNSNLQRVLDIVLSFQSGIGYEVSAKGTVFRGMVDDIVGGIHCSLSFPYEDMFTSDDGAGNKGYLTPELLPKIDTAAFGIGGGALTVDYSAFGYGGLQEMSLGGVYFKTVDILYNGSVIGQYTVNTLSSTIDIIFFHFDAVVTLDTIFGVEGSDEYARFDIVYPFGNEMVTNIPFVKNTIPRLLKVSFKDN